MEQIELNENVTAAVEEENRLYREYMTNVQESYWQQRLVLTLKLVDELETEIGQMRENRAASGA